MADSGALRVRRARLHKAGDHSLCRRCPARGDQADVTLAAAPAADAGPGVDPDAMMRNLALRLEAAHESDPSNAMVAAALLKTLQALGGGGKADGDLTGLLAVLAES